METSFVRPLVVVALGSLAYHALTAAALPWAPLLAPGSGRVALQFANTAVLLLVSAPFAAILSRPRLSAGSPARLAMCISIAGLVLPLLPDLGLVLRPGAAGASAVLDVLKFVLVLPVLTWLLARRWRPRDARRPPLGGTA